MKKFQYGNYDVTVYMDWPKFDPNCPFVVQVCGTRGGHAVGREEPIPRGNEKDMLKVIAVVKRLIAFIER